MEEKIKEIISAFTKIPSGEIGPATPIDRSTVKSSILLHRMFAKLAEEGLRVENYAAVRTYSDLMAGQAAGGQTTGIASVKGEAASIVVPFTAVGDGGIAGGIGIDIEELSAMPRTHDFRKEEFYTMNFTSSEIAYCILQPDPYASFAGMFAAKEAIVKADGKYRSMNFSSIGITHSPEGKPLYPGMHLSVAHAGTAAVAVAIPVGVRGPVIAAPEAPVSSARQGGNMSWVSWLALLLSIIAIIVIFTR